MWRLSRWSQTSSFRAISQACACCRMQAQALESAVKRFSKLEDTVAEVVLAQEVHAVSCAT
jgi:hypothetical protein